MVDKITESSKRVMSWALIGLLGVAIFFMPILEGITYTGQLIIYFHSDNSMKKMTTFLNQHTPNNSYIFFSMTHTLYDLEFYSTANYVGSFPFFGWEYNRLSSENYSKAYRRNTLSYVLNIISHDLDDKKPQFVIVDIASSQDYLNQRIDFAQPESQIF